MCEISTQAILNATRKFTYSQALEAGHSHSGWLIGPMTDLLGQVRALVSHSVSPERAAAQKTRDTCGQLFGGSSPSDVLQQSLENRLRARLAGRGSVEYVLTWKRWDMPSGLPICALRASALRTSGKGWGGGPTASGRDWKDTPGMSATGTNPDGTVRKRLDQLPRVASLTGPAPSGGPAGTGSGDGCQRGGWATARACDGEKNQRTVEGAMKEPARKGNLDELGSMAQMAGWQTPKGTGGGNVSRGNDRKGEQLLAGEAQMTGWPTPMAQTPAQNGNNAAGNSDSSRATVAKVQTPDMTGWKLNPRFSLWLMGYPDAWASCGARAMQSCRKSRRRS